MRRGSHVVPGSRRGPESKQWSQKRWTPGAGWETLAGKVGEQNELTMQQPKDAREEKHTPRAYDILQLRKCTLVSLDER